MEVKLPIACLLLQTLLLLTTVKEAHCYRENGDLQGNVAHWALKLFHHFADDTDRDKLFGGRSLAIQRERAMDLAEDWDKTGLSAILEYSCDHDLCRAAKARSECTDLATDDNEAMTKLLLRRDGDDLTRWVVDCRRMLRVELPAEDGGLPGARSLGGQDERGRLASGEESSPTEPEVGPSVKPPVVKNMVPVSSLASTMSGQAASPGVNCSHLFLHRPTDFHTECCLKVSVQEALKDNRCTLTALLERTETKSDLLVPSPSSPGVKVTNMTQKEPVSKGTSGNKTSQGGDVSQLGKSLEGQEEDGEDVLVQETGSWRSKYFVILGFFLVFFFLFLIVIGFLVWKLRRTKTFTPPASPGAGALGGLNATQQRTRGYSAIEGEEEQEGGAATPATQQAQAFQFQD